MTDRPPPHNLDAERSLLGAVLLRPDTIPAAARTVTAADFYQPTHAAVFDAVVRLHRRGATVDPVVVRDALARSGAPVADADLAELVAAVPATTNAAAYARIVADHAVARALAAAAADIRELAFTAGDVGDAVDQAKRLLDTVATATRATGVHVESLDDLVARDDGVHDWVIPGLLARSDRVVLVAPEGYGKSMLWRQIAVMVGQGLNPFTHEEIPAQRTLLVDLENPEPIVRRTCRPIVAAARRTLPAYAPHRALWWHEPGGVDIRTRTGFGAVEHALETARPDLVCLGPLYKLYRTGKGESMEDAALDVTARLDDLRTRFGFALFVEHHAPKGGYGARDMVPFGSSVWQRWPEFGPALTPAEPNNRTRLRWGEWRGPREVRPWPVELTRGQVWPWDAVTRTPAGAVA